MKCYYNPLVILDPNAVLIEVFIILFDLGQI